MKNQKRIIPRFILLNWLFTTWAVIYVMPNSNWYFLFVPANFYLHAWLENTYLKIVNEREKAFLI